MRKTLATIAIVPLLALGACSKTESPVKLHPSAGRVGESAGTGGAGSAGGSTPTTSSMPTDSAPAGDSSAAPTTGGGGSGSAPSFSGDVMEDTFLKLVKEDKYGTIGQDPENAKKLASQACGSLSAPGGTITGAAKSVRDSKSDLTDKQSRDFVILAITSLCSDQTEKVGT